MTDLAHEPKPNLSFRLTVPLMAAIIRDNPEFETRINKQVIDQVLRKFSMESLEKRVSEEADKNFERMKNQMCSEICEALGGKSRIQWNSRTCQYEYVWEVTADLREKIREHADSILINVIRETLTDDRITEVLNQMATRYVERMMGDLLNAQIEGVVNRVLKKKLGS